MYHQSNQISVLRLWWRRQSFIIRHLPLRCILFVFLVLLFLITISPNPFSSEYSSIHIVQNVDWENIDELLKTKELLNKNDTFSIEVKFIQHGTNLKQTNKPLLILLYTTIFLNKKILFIYCRTNLWYDVSIEKSLSMVVRSSKIIRSRCDYFSRTGYSIFSSSST